MNWLSGLEQKPREFPIGINGKDFAMKKIREFLMLYYEPIIGGAIGGILSAVVCHLFMT